jgi:hypothetical protein
MELQYRIATENYLNHKIAATISKELKQKQKKI